MQHGKSHLELFSPRSRFYKGTFGRLFSLLEPWTPPGVPEHQLEAHLQALANETMVEAPGISPTTIAENDTLRKELDEAFDAIVPAGYTYFGQFVDHDLTLDITALSDAEVDPDRLTNFRSPRFDLDCLYGRGPGDQPYLYEHKDPVGFTGRMLIGDIAGSGFRDLQRNAEGRAIIADKRNDENAIVAQLQLAFTLAHNKLVDRALASGQADNATDAFKAAQRVLRWLYQWIVWNDFVPRFTQSAVHAAALSKSDASVAGRSVWRLGLEDIFSWRNQPFMPVEFSVAAYRFGHSLVRNSYQTNVSSAAGFQEFVPIFDIGADDDLRGFRPLEQRRVVQWDWFLEMSSSSAPFPQRARKIDTKLSNALAFLPESLADPTSIENVLAARNLLRGVRMKLPSGPDVARHLGIEPLVLEDQEPHALWFYVLKEAEVQEAGLRLGELGSLLVCAVFAGLLKGDPRSWINQNPLWTPEDEPLLEPLDNQDPGDWTLASLIRLSGLPISNDSFTN